MESEKVLRYPQVGGFMESLVCNRVGLVHQSHIPNFAIDIGGFEMVCTYATEANIDNLKGHWKNKVYSSFANNLRCCIQPH
jgi:hypothetical protein